MNYKTATVDQIMAMRPCAGYSRERVTALWAGKKRLTVTQIAALDIPVQDRIWALLKDHFFTHQELVLLACDFAEDALPEYEKYYSDGKAPRLAIAAARAWAKNPTDKNRSAAESAAERAAESAAWAAAWAAAWDAAWDAARPAAGDAQLAHIVRFAKGVRREN